MQAELCFYMFWQCAIVFSFGFTLGFLVSALWSVTFNLVRRASSLGSGSMVDVYFPDSNSHDLKIMFVLKLWCEFHWRKFDVQRFQNFWYFFEIKHFGTHIALEFPIFYMINMFQFLCRTPLTALLPADLTTRTVHFFRLVPLNTWKFRGVLR